MPQSVNDPRAGLGLHLGLNPRQRQRARELDFAGSGREGLGGGFGLGGGQRERLRTEAKNQMAGSSGPGQGPGAGAPPPQTKNPGAGSARPDSVQSVAAAPPPGTVVQQPTPAAPPSPKNSGAGNTGPAPTSGGPFQMQEWYGGNPLETAQRMAQQYTQEQLAQTRARFGSMGLGNSSRSALAEGDVISRGGAMLADVLAGRGIGAYESDANRALAANNALAQLGTGLTGIGANEQNIPGLSAIMNLISMLSGQDIYGGSNQGGSGGWWTS